MSKKFTAQRRNAFLRALAQTGNQTIAAERAKVSRSWVQLHRSTDPAFRAAVEGAVAAAKARLEGAASRAPDAGPDYHDGAELVVRGSNGRRTQIARARTRQWSPRVEQRFLAELAATCNVKAACAAVGLTAASAYGHRHRWQRFAHMWDEALETGYIRIEMALLENAANLHSEPEHPLELPLPDMTTADAIHLLHMHKHQVHGIGRRPGRRERMADMEKVRESILRKIEAIERFDARVARRTGQAAEADAGSGEAAGETARAPRVPPRIRQL